MGCCGDNRVAPLPGRREVEEHFDGPLKNRSCTDVVFLIFFVAFLGGMGYTCGLAYTRGDPYRLIFGQDSWGNACNQKYNRKIDGVSLSGRDTSKLPNAFYFDPKAIANPDLVESTVVCVSKCPNETIVTTSQLKDHANNYGVFLCKYDILPSSGYFSLQAASSTTGDCPGPQATLPSVSVLNRCMPEILMQAGSSLVSAAGAAITSALDLIQANCEAGGDFFDAATSDIEKSWKEILYMCAISLGLALILTFLMRFIAAIIIWILVIGCALGSLAGAGYSWYRWYDFKSAYDKLEEENKTDVKAKQVKNWLIISCCVTAAAAIILLILLVMRKRIALVVQLFREAGKAIGKMPMLLIQPLWTLLFLLTFFMGLIYLFLYIETAGDPVIDSRGHVTYKKDDVLKYMKWYYIFGILWVIQFVLACHQMVIAGSVASWYFCRDKSKIGWPILTSIRRLIIYHLGSVALGSLLIALVQFARLILGYIHKKLHGRAGPVVDCLLKCLQCCLWCFEKLLKFINWNAYIMIAIYGYNFCKAAQRGFSLIVANVLRVGAINSVGTFTLILGKIGVVAITIVIGMEVFFKNEDELCYMWVPYLLAGIFAFLVAHAFLSIYGMAIDTIFLAFCEDCEHNDGVSKPYWMSKGLMQYVSNSDEAISALEAREARIKRKVAARKAKRKVAPNEVTTTTHGESANKPAPNMYDFFI